MTRSRACLVGALLIFSTRLGAQQPGALVPLGAIRVPACPPAADPEYGLVAAKAVAIGGGPVYMTARQRNYLNALRGPNGQMLRIGDGIASQMLRPNGADMVIIDTFTVTYDGANGPVTTSIYMDAYHYDAPKVPAGFTCGAPLATAAPIPPADPMKITPLVLALAVEQGTANDVAAIPLDPASPRGYLFDRFGSVALRARAAAVAGTPLDSKTPSRDLQANGLTVLAIPTTCGDRSIAPVSIELSTAQAAVPQETLLKGDELPKAFPGLPTPAGSIGARFRNAQPTQAKITYSEGCNGAPAVVMLPLRREAPRLVELVPGVMPPGVVENEPVVYIQVVIDPAGRIARTEYLGGPQSLYPAALEALAKWRVQPIRVNGAGVATPNVVQVPFRP